MADDWAPKSGFRGRYCKHKELEYRSYGEISRLPTRWCPKQRARGLALALALALGHEQLFRR
jgi:hypothetical protein